MLNNKDQPYHDYDWLYDQYITQRKSIRTISKEFNCDFGTLRIWLNKHGIKKESKDFRQKTYWQNKEWLTDEYVNKKRTTVDIGKELGKSACTISWWLNKLGIEVRNASDAKEVVNKVKRQKDPKPWYDRDWLHNQYADQLKSSNKIAEECGVKKHTIDNWLKKHNIPMRDLHKAETMYQAKRLFGDTNAPYHNKDWLYNEYVVNKKSIKSISKELNCSEHTVTDWLNKHDIKMREQSTNCKLHCSRGENHYAWKGGFDRHGYCNKFNEKFRESIRNKYKRKCYACAMTEKENGAKMAVHHIDYSKSALCKGRKFAFVPLCKTCHAKSTSHRFEWFHLLIHYWAIDEEITLKEFPFKAIVTKKEVS